VLTQYANGFYEEWTAGVNDRIEGEAAEAEPHRGSGRHDAGWPT
jgi:hypothetical protein